MPFLFRARGGGCEPRRGIGSPSEGRSPGTAAPRRSLFVPGSIRPNGPRVQSYAYRSSIAMPCLPPGIGNRANCWPVGPNTARHNIIRGMAEIPGLRPSLDERLGLRPGGLPVLLHGTKSLHGLCRARLRNPSTLRSPLLGIVVKSGLSQFSICDRPLRKGRTFIQLRSKDRLRSRHIFVFGFGRSRLGHTPVSWPFPR